MKILAGVFCMKRTKFFRACLSSLQHSNVELFACAMDSISVSEAITDSISSYNIDSTPAKKVLYQNYRYFVERYFTNAYDYIILCADDYIWNNGWYKKLESFLSGLKAPISHLSGELEPSFPWNEIRKEYNINGITGLTRDTVCGANWIFPAATWHDIQSFWKSYEHDITFDHILNGYQRNRGKEMIALNLADHVGAYESTMGNMAFQLQAVPLAKKYRNI